MISNSVNEKMISFKELEKKIFKYVCELGCEITRSILEAYDDAESMEPLQKMERKLMYIFWMRKCAWIRSA